MSQWERRVLVATAGIVVLMLLFPPFHYPAPGGAVLNLGYAFILDPPKAFERADYRGSVNTPLLALQILAAVIAGTLISFAVRFGDRSAHRLPGNLGEATWRESSTLPSRELRRQEASELQCARCRTVRPSRYYFVQDAETPVLLCTTCAEGMSSADVQRFTAGGA